MGYSIDWFLMGWRSRYQVQPVVYILASKRSGTLYIGVTNNLPKRIYEHKNGLVEGFTRKYKVHNLMYMKCMTISERL